ncbi:MAG: hypothetical protein JNL98_05645 [Bryobacterales bacterium]|nr:hypothetical protein [Bryobacterales bacterium]
MHSEPGRLAPAARGELGEVLAGLVTGRTRNEVSVFKSLGMAVEDVAVGFLALSTRFS